MATKKIYKLALWPLLKNISIKNIKYYEVLSKTEDSLKEFSPYLIMRWLTGCNDGTDLAARQIYFLNEIVNPYVFLLGTKHKQLFYYLMTICTTGKEYKYVFNKSDNGRRVKMPKTISIIKEVFGYNDKDSMDAIVLLTDAAIISMAEQLGRQDGELSELKKELKTKRPK